MIQLPKAVGSLGTAPRPQQERRNQAQGVGETDIAGLCKQIRVEVERQPVKLQSSRYYLLVAGGPHSIMPGSPGSDSVNASILQRVKEKFQIADKDGSGELEVEEFVEAFTGILQTEDGSDKAALAKLFMRIDANSDGTVTWDEFSGYMLLESQGSASLREFEAMVTFDPPERVFIPESHWHKSPITHVQHVHLSNGVDRYITSGKDGLVKIWSVDLQHIKTFNTGSSWVTCSKMMPMTQKLAVATFGRFMRIYDLASYEVCGLISDLEYAPLAMDVWAAPKKKASEFIAFGDGGGCVRLYEVKVNPMEDKNSSDRFTDVCRWSEPLHTDWVVAVKYCEDLNSILAASLDKTVSISDPERRVPLKRLDGHHTKGVTCIDWSPIYKVVATGSQDRRLLLWNPFSQRPLAMLAGHTASVQHVIMNDKDNQVISIGVDKSIKIWDIRNHKCLQTIHDREQYQDDVIGGATFDKTRKTLVTGNLYPKLWRQRVTAADRAAHMAPISKVLFNHNFNEAVTGDHDGTVSVWHVPSGKLRFRFHQAHGEERITALAFDTAKRRLLTGSESGEVKAWNFSSGACLSRCKSRSGQEVSAVGTIRGALAKYIIAAGWDRKVTFYEDAGAKQVPPGKVISGHNADILAMALMDGTPTLVTAADDGEICVWNVESGAVKRRLLPPHHHQKPTNEQSVDALAFLKGRLRHVLAAVGSDRMLRLWDVLDGTLLAEVFTGHMTGETIQGLAVDAHNQRLATGDSGGFVKLWGIADFVDRHTLANERSRRTPTPGGLQHSEVQELLVWRAHKRAVTSLDFAETSQGCFLLSSSFDCTIKLWSHDGAPVGTFGSHQWRLEDPGTWQSQQPVPLDEQDQFTMEESCALPAYADSRDLMKNQFSFAQNLDSTGSEPSAPSTARTRPSTAPLQVAQVCEASYIHRIHRIQSMQRSTPRQQSAATSTCSSPRAPPRSMHSMLRPASAALHTQASQSSTSTLPLSSRCKTPLNHHLHQSQTDAQQLPAQMSDLHVARGSWQEPVHAMGSHGQTASNQPHAHHETVDEADEHGIFSDSSSSHESDADVPMSLWLDEFDAAKRTRASGLPISTANGLLFRGTSAGRHNVFLPHGSTGLNHTSTTGRKDGSVAHLLHVADLSKTQDKPMTSYRSFKQVP